MTIVCSVVCLSHDVWLHVMYMCNMVKCESDIPSSNFMAWVFIQYPWNSDANMLRRFYSRSSPHRRKYWYKSNFTRIRHEQMLVLITELSLLSIWYRSILVPSYRAGLSTSEFKQRLPRSDLGLVTVCLKHQYPSVRGTAVGPDTNVFQGSAVVQGSDYWICRIIETCLRPRLGPQHILKHNASVISRLWGRGIIPIKPAHLFKHGSQTAKLSIILQGLFFQYLDCSLSNSFWETCSDRNSWVLWAHAQTNTTTTTQSYIKTSRLRG